MSQFTKHTSGPIDTSNPWSDDVLKRRELAQQLTAALSTVTQPFVLGLHGEFGNGKTFFIKRWQQELLNSGDVAVYFNAWETDYAADPLIAFTAAIKKQLEAHDLIGGKEAAKALASSAGRIVLKSVLPRAISLATGGLLQASDVSTLTAMGDEIAGAASDITERAIEEAVKRHEEAREEIEHFLSILTDCAEEIAKREKGVVRRLIVFVDELDRCRPDYAVQVLECIKHFFAVPNVIFVIAIDRNALNQSIHTVYGDCIEVDGYLRKFFDYHVELGPPNHQAFAELLARSFRLNEVIRGDLDRWLKTFSNWSRGLDLSLRVQEQILSQANFVMRSYPPNNDDSLYYLIMIALLLKAKDPGALDRILSGHHGLGDMQSEIARLVIPGIENDDLEESLQVGIKFLLATFGSSEVIKLESKEIKDKLEGKSAENLADRERRELEGRLDTLDWAFRLAKGPGKRLGLGVIRRMRFLTD